MKKQNEGITLVALVITIIVLIILAGVSINAVMNGGLIDNAKDAKENYDIAKEKEEKELSQLKIDSVDIEFIQNNVPYKFKHIYLTGIDITTKVSTLKQNLAKVGYELYNIDGTEITNEDAFVSTGMQIKKGEDEIGRAIIFGDYSTVELLNQGKYDTNDNGIFVDILLGNEVADYIKVAMDVNHDGIINLKDQELILQEMLGNRVIEQNSYALDPDAIEIKTQAELEESYLNDLQKKKSKYTIEWSNEEGYNCYVIKGIEEGTLVEEVLTAIEVSPYTVSVRNKNASASIEFDDEVVISYPDNGVIISAFVVF